MCRMSQIRPGGATPSLAVTTRMFIWLTLTPRRTKGVVIQAGDRPVQNPDPYREAFARHPIDDRLIRVSSAHAEYPQYD